MRWSFSLVVFAALAICGCKRPESSGGDLSEDSDASWVQDAAAAASSAADAAGAQPSFAGSYTSTEGRATITQSDRAVTIRYPNGRADCIAQARVLTCTWREAESFGQAKLTQIGGRKLVGTYGVGKSETDAGEWQFVPIVADAGS